MCALRGTSPLGQLDREMNRQIRSLPLWAAGRFAQRPQPSAYSPKMSTRSPLNAAPRSPIALRFVSGKYKGGEYRVDDGRDAVVGRSSDVDVVLVEEMVSRQHARVGFRGGALTVEDLGSTNGTFVNGERIRESTVLRVGDLIHIGTSVLLVVDEAGKEPLDFHEPELLPLGKMPFVRQPATVESSVEELPRMAGSLEEIAVEDLLQLFSSSRKTGVLAVRTLGHAARIVLAEGRLRYALVEGEVESNPMKAICRIVAWRQGSFELQPPDSEAYPAAVDMGVQEVLMEAFRQQDELSTVSEVLPPLDSRLALKSPLEAPLHALEPQNLEILQLAINCPNLQTLFDRSGLLDLEVARVVAQLLDRGYLEVAAQ